MFTQGFSKEAAGPRIIHDPNLLDNGRVGFHVKRQTIDEAAKTNPQVAKELVQHKFKPGQDALVLAPREQLKRLYGADGKAAYDVTRRHEMTHWLRNRRGKMKGVGEPGLMNVLRTGREEAAAHFSTLKTRGLNPQQRHGVARGVFPGILSSMRTAYPQGIFKAMLGRKK